MSKASADNRYFLIRFKDRNFYVALKALHLNLAEANILSLTLKVSSCLKYIKESNCQDPVVSDPFFLGPICRGTRDPFVRDSFHLGSICPGPICLISTDGCHYGHFCFDLKNLISTLF